MRRVMLDAKMMGEARNMLANHEKMLPSAGWIKTEYQFSPSAFASVGAAAEAESCTPTAGEDWTIWGRHRCDIAGKELSVGKMKSICYPRLKSIVSWWISFRILPIHPLTKVNGFLTNSKIRIVGNTSTIIFRNANPSANITQEVWTDTNGNMPVERLWHGM